MGFLYICPSAAVVTATERHFDHDWHRSDCCLLHVLAAHRPGRANQCRGRNGLPRGGGGRANSGGTHNPALSRLLWACVVCNRRLGPATTLGCVRVFPPSTRFQEWGNYTTSGINAIQIIVMSNVYRTMARKLTDFGAESRILCFVRGGGVEGLGGACRRRAGSRYCPRFVFV